METHEQETTKTNVALVWKVKKLREPLIIAAAALIGIILKLLTDI